MRADVYVRTFAKLLSGIAAMTLFASQGACGPVSVCEGAYQVPVLANGAAVTTISEADACGAVVHTEGGTGDDRYMKDLYGFISYKDKITETRMLDFQKFVAGFINRASGQTAGALTTADPVISKLPGTEVHHFLQHFSLVHGDRTFSGAYEIITRVQGDVTNSYFIGYADASGRPAFYNEFGEWALK